MHMCWTAIKKTKHQDIKNIFDRDQKRNEKIAKEQHGEQKQHRQLTIPLEQVDF